MRRRFERKYIEGAQARGRTGAEPRGATTKDAIGEWHDWEELVAIAREVLDHGANCRLLREIRRIADTKYRNALRLTQAMIKKFLRMPERGDKRNVQHRQRGPAEPVWLATGALVA